MVSSLLLLAATTAEGAHAEESSHLPFYVAGVALALWAVAVAALGIPRRNFPTTRRARNAIMLVTTLLVVATCGSAALTG